MIGINRKQALQRDGSAFDHFSNESQNNCRTTMVDLSCKAEAIRGTFDATCSSETAATGSPWLNDRAKSCANSCVCDNSSRVTMPPRTLSSSPRDSKSPIAECVQSTATIVTPDVPWSACGDITATTSSVKTPRVGTVATAESSSVPANENQASGRSLGNRMRDDESQLNGLRSMILGSMSKNDCAEVYQNTPRDSEKYTPREITSKAGNDASEHLQDAIAGLFMMTQSPVSGKQKSTRTIPVEEKTVIAPRDAAAGLLMMTQSSPKKSSKTNWGFSNELSGVSGFLSRSKSSSNSHSPPNPEGDEPSTPSLSSIGLRHSMPSASSYPPPYSPNPYHRVLPMEGIHAPIDILSYHPMNHPASDCGPHSMFNLEQPYQYLPFHQTTTNSLEATPAAFQQHPQEQLSMKKQKFTCQEESVWAMRFNQAVEFKEKHGHCRIPYQYPPNKDLARWAKRQKYQYKLFIGERNSWEKKSSLTKQRIESLENLGFCWDAQQESWDEQFDALVGYIHRYGHAKVPKREKSLGRWVCSQRTRVSQGKMTLERFMKLEAVGFVWASQTPTQNFIVQVDKMREKAIKAMKKDVKLAKKFVEWQDKVKGVGGLSRSRLDNIPDVAWGKVCKVSAKSDNSGPPSMQETCTEELEAAFAESSHEDGDSN